MKNILTKLLLVIFTAIFLFSGYNLLKIFLEYHAGTSEYSQAANQYVKEKEDGNKEPVADLEEGSDTCPIEIDFASLQAENPDVVGWIYSPDTVINYPVMKGETNDTYLHTMLNGQYNSSGSIFMDYRNNPDLSDYVTILYGHHMKNGSMFVSPFIGWKEANGEDGRRYISDIVQTYKNYGWYGKTQIICAAVRTGRQIADCAIAGADIVTAGMAVYQDSMVHPYTGQGMDIFRSAWDNTAK